jgi:hypothetical protein
VSVVSCCFGAPRAVPDIISSTTSVECVEGILYGNMTTCNEDGSNGTIVAEPFQCRPGYYKTFNPNNCTGTSQPEACEQILFSSVVFGYLTAMLAVRTVCVAGMSPPTASFCDSTGGNIAALTNYTCNAGYYDSGAPAYCTRMYMAPGNVLSG